MNKNEWVVNGVSIYNKVGELVLKSTTWHRTGILQQICDEHNNIKILLQENENLKVYLLDLCDEILNEYNKTNQCESIITKKALEIKSLVELMIKRWE